MKKKKILLVDYNYTRAWKDIFLETTYTVLKKEGFDVTYLDVSSYALLNDWLHSQASDFDVVWFFTDLDEKGIVDFRYELKKKGVKVIGQSQGFYDNPYEEGSYKGYSFKYLLDSMDYLFVNTDYVKDEYSKIKSNVKYYTLGLPLYEHKKYNYNHSGGKEYDVIFGGRFVPEKGHFLILNLAIMLRKLGYSVMITAPGTNNFYKFIHMFDEYGINHRFQCFNDEYLEILRKSNFFVSFSFIDTLNISVLEAMNEGVKVILPNIRPFSDYCDKRLLYTPYNLEEILKKIKKYKDTPAKSFKHKNRDFYTFNAYSERLSKFIKKELK